MSVQSMTGFVSQEGHFEDISWTWELRSLNGKGLDIRTRVPSGYEQIDLQARKRCANAFKRGNIQVVLRFEFGDQRQRLQINKDLALEVYESARALQEHVGGEMPSVADLLNVRGVVEFEDNTISPEAQDAVNSSVLASLDEAIKGLEAERLREGNALVSVVSTQLQALQKARLAIEKNGDRKPEKIRNKLQQQLNNLLKDKQEMDEQRLMQEVVVLATKADLQEELDRLALHLDNACQLLEEGGAIGRKLDFLAQELNRECNTICSKSNSAEVTSIGLDIKLLIDQFREQIQNVE